MAFRTDAPRGLLILAMACCCAVLSPSWAWASDYEAAPTVDEVVDVGIGGQVQWFGRAVQVEAVQHHAAVAWAPALPPITSQNASYALRRTWGTVTPGLADSRQPPSTPGARRPYLLGIGTSDGALRLPKPGSDLLTITGRFVDTGEPTSLPVSLTPDPFAYRTPGQLSDVQVAALDGALGQAAEQRPHPLRVAATWPLLWWPHLLLAACIGLLLTTRRSRVSAGRTRPRRGDHNDDVRTPQRLRLPAREGR